MIDSVAFGVWMDIWRFATAVGVLANGIVFGHTVWTLLSMFLENKNGIGRIISMRHIGAEMARFVMQLGMAYYIWRAQYYEEVLITFPFALEHIAGGVFFSSLLTSQGVWDLVWQEKAIRYERRQDGHHA